MEFYDAVKGRRSVRAFSGKAAEPGKLKRILETCMRAPSAGNLQSYKIIIVRSKGALEGLAVASDQDFITQAEVAFVFLADRGRAEAKYGERGFELYAEQDATIAAAYCQLAATAEGLSSVWVGAFDPLEVSRIVAALAHEVPVAIIPVGHAAESPELSERRPQNEVVREV